MNQGKCRSEEKSIALAEEKLNNKMQVKELARCDDENDFVMMIRVKVGNAYAVMWCKRSATGHGVKA